MRSIIPCLLPAHFHSSYITEWIVTSRAIAQLFTNGKRVEFFVCTMPPFQYPASFSTCAQMSRVNDYDTTCKEQGQLKETLIAIDHKVDYVYLLQNCITKKCVTESKLIHAHMTEIRFEPYKIFENTLLSMYAKCGCVSDARRVFDGISERNGVSWTVMISAYARHGRYGEAVAVFDEMQRKGIQPSGFVYASVLPALAKLAPVQRCREVHEEIVRGGLQADVFLSNILVDMYAKTGNMLDARDVFDKMSLRNSVSWNMMISGYAKNGRVGDAMDLFGRMPDRDVVSWTAMIAGYVQNGYAEEALKLYRQMQLTGICPNSKTLGSILSTCANLPALEQGKEIHAEIVASGLLSALTVGNALVDMYAKCGSIDDACKVFEKMPKKDVVSWNAMLSGYVQNGHVEEAMKLFQRMPHHNVVSWTAMIAGYAQNGHAEEALKLFQDMQNTGVKPNAKTFASLLPACANLVALEKGMEIHEEIEESGLHSNVFVVNALVDMYAKCGSVENARNLFDRMDEPSIISWTAIIAGYTQNGEGEEAIKLFRQMQVEGVKPNSTTLASILPACANMAALEQGREIHGKIIRSGCHFNVFVGTALMDMYAKCGSLQNARKTFDNMSEQNVVPCNAMITGYAVNGFGKEAIKLFEQMKVVRINPNQVTFVGVLSACCHSGLLEEGLHYFDQMKQCYQLKPSMEHYACMVDLLGRAGRLDEANDFIHKMPMKPNPNVWGSLLGACTIHQNIELGERVANYLFELDPTNAAYYVHISNMYAAAGRWDDIQNTRKMMNDRRVRKKPGCSWIEVNKHVHVFVAGGRSMQDHFSMSTIS